MNLIKPILTLSLWLIFSIALFAQNEVERKLLSLQGLQQFGFTAAIEGSRIIADSESLTPSVIRQDAINRIVENGLQFVSDEEVRSSTEIPFLYMHINAMEMENGLIPFSIQLKLYQPVKLVLNRDMQASAITWEHGMVGLVSYDRLSTIQNAAQELIMIFIEDYQTQNRRRGRR
jgi:hypothetical protein